LDDEEEKQTIKTNQNQQRKMIDSSKTKGNETKRETSNKEK